jgi:peptide/nickel transport system substrate-binding protein
MRRRDFLIGSVVSAASALPVRWSQAETRAESLRILSEAAPNSFDPYSIGVNRNAIQAHWNTYDRLVAFGSRKTDDGAFHYDYFHIEPSLAESYEFADDGRSIVFHLRPDATFHDGSPVTAADVKWSLDRVLASPIGASQFKTGSLTSPDQFVVVNEHTFKATTPRPDRFTLPNLALTYPVIFNSKLARSHASDSDPWAAEWLKTNIAGGGPFKLDNFTPGQSYQFSRFDGWKNGAPPGFARVLWQIAPSAQARRSSLEKGDADIVQDLPPQDAVSLASNSALRVVGAPMLGAFQFIGMNCQLKPFDNVKVRQAIAYALPYEQMFEAALFKRGRPLFGGKPGEPDSTQFPQPLGYSTDPDQARALLAEAGLAGGFETTFTFELSNAQIGEPVSLLVQEALGKLGIRVAINKAPGGQLGTLLEKKQIPFFFEASSAFLSDPDYFFRIFYNGATRWNFGSYQNPELAELIEKSRFETDKATYDAEIKRMITLAKQDVPILLLWQPTLDTGMQRSVDGYTYLFHRQLELRTLKRT